MATKIAIGLCIAAAVIWYLIGSISLALVSIAFALIQLVVGFLMTWIAVRPITKEFEDTVAAMERQGATTEEIEAYMDRHSQSHDNEAYWDLVPRWIPAVLNISNVVSLVLFIMAVVRWI